MKTSILKSLLAVSLALNLGTIAAVLMNKLDSATPSQASLPDMLQLTAGQRQRWQQLELPFLQDIGQNWRAIRAHREALVGQVFAGGEPQRSAIDAEQAAIAALQDAQQRRVIEQLLAERALLDERQRAILMKLLLSRYAKEATEEESLHQHDKVQRQAEGGK